MPNTVLYLAGLGRSGSTILERMIGELDGVCPAGELLYVCERGVNDDEPCGCGKPFSGCPFWVSVGAAAFGGWAEVDVARIEMLRRSVDRTRRIPQMLRHSPTSEFGKALREYTDFYAALYSGLREVSGARVVVDSSKHPSLAFALAARGDLDLRVVQMVRDPRAVAYSWSRPTSRPEAVADRAVPEFPVWRPARTAGLWLGHNSSLPMLQRRGVPVLTVRHEDVVASPRATLARIASWAGLGDDIDLPVSEDGVAQLGVAHTVSGNPMRFRVGSVPIVGDENWRSGLPARDAATVTAITLPLLHRFGYPVRTSTPGTE